jgi:crossover junction endodeoxyribonuclease RuvC
MADHPLRILGVDPSLRCTGVGIVEQQGTALRGIEFGTIRNARNLRHSECLQRVQVGLLECIEAGKPSAAAIEGGFHLKNARTAMVLGEVRGVVIATCAARGLEVFEYSPRRVKQSIVGTGTAHKEQVGRMVMSILGLQQKLPEDAADALAIAMCHLHSLSGYQALDASPL